MNRKQFIDGRYITYQDEINASDASMLGPVDYGPGSFQSDRFDDRYNSYYGYGAPSAANTSKPNSFSWRSSSPKDLHFGKGPKDFPISDARILEEVSEILSAHPEIDASEVIVEVNKGVVTLSGAVESKHIKRLAEDIIESIRGVVEIQNDLEFKAKPHPYPFI